MNDAALQPSGLEMGLVSIGGILGLIAFVLGIVVCVKMFQNNQAALGIISILLMLCTGIGFLIALVFGWVKSKEWNIKGLMTAYTAALALSIILGGAGYAMMFPKLMKAAQEQQQMMMEQMQDVPPDGVQIENVDPVP